MWMILLESVVVGFSVLLLMATVAGSTTHPHWAVRACDFPRAQILLAMMMLAGIEAGLFLDGYWLRWLLLVALAVGMVWQARYILPYTPLMPKQVHPHRQPPGPQSFRMVVSNVEMDNHEHDRWLHVVREQDADLILVLEVNDRWMSCLEELRGQYPHVIAQPQDNCYGMALLSKLELIEPQVQYLVQDDIPSIHTQVQLSSGERIRLHGLHPRPPEPIRDQNAVPRDAELVIVGQQVRDEKQQRPTIVAGDLNDVAWSRTTRLFLHLSGMLDPRRGRGFYNSFHARHRLMRFPLDHVFHTHDFRLIELRLLEAVGSDHFPVLIELSHEPMAQHEQPEPEPAAGDEAEAREKVERQRKA